MRKVIFIVAAALVVSTPAVATHMSQTSATGEDKDRMKCKPRQKTGTRFGGKDCRTVAEWEAIAEAAKRSASETINRPAIETRRE